MRLVIKSKLNPTDGHPKAPVLVEQVQPKKIARADLGQYVQVGTIRGRLFCKLLKDRLQKEDSPRFLPAKNRHMQQ